MVMAAISEELIFDNTDVSEMEHSSLSGRNNAKRTLDEEEEEQSMETGDEKRIACTDSEVIFKLLCPTSRVSRVIGKGGEVINRLRAESGAKIQVKDRISGCDERLILISAEDSPISTETCPSQVALCAVVEAMLGSSESESGDSEDCDDEGTETVRLLAHTSQVGGLIGKGGEAINDIRVRTGASVRVLPRTDLPVCAPRTDELCQVTGNLRQVRLAVGEISTRLRNNPIKEKTPRRSTLQPEMKRSGDRAESFDADRGTGMVYRFLAPVSKAGFVIGRSGEHIHRIRQETGALVHLEPVQDGCEWRVVIVKSSEEDTGTYCGAQEALLRCVYRCCKEDEAGKLSVRLLLMPGQVGAVLGKGGRVISALRMESGADIRVIVREDDQNDVLSCSESGEAMVVVEGRPAAVDAALRAVMLCLRGDATVYHQPRAAVTSDRRSVRLIPSYSNTSNGRRASTVDVDSSRKGTKVVMHIAPGQVGAVIGKGGANITQIRDISGAGVRLVESEGSGDRELEITGSEAQCHSANNLVQAFLWRDASHVIAL